mmetsp:Transcript_5957/g.12094  ORF Transcript_5957/g.12094 Transcript_5957/m.12094 type:complete len:208 (+) Transcript_5957:681-1304(+)
MTFRDFQFVPRKCRRELVCQIFQPSLHGYDLFSHIGSNHCKSPARLHIAHQLIAVTSGSSHNKRQFVFGIKYTIGIDRRRMCVINGQNILLSGSFPQTRERRHDLIASLVGRRDETQAGRFVSNGIDDGDGAGFDFGTGHGDGREGESFTKACFGGSCGHGTRHSIYHDFESGRIKVAVGAHFERGTLFRCDGGIQGEGLGAGDGSK